MLSGKTSLIIQADNITRHLVAEVLGAEGCQTIQASGTQEAQQKLNALAALDFLVLDDNVAGFSLIEPARSRFKNLKVIVITEKDIDQSARRPGIDKVIQIPFQVFNLCEDIKDVLR
jgi:CheY-like chemotaxis protein